MLPSAFPRLNNVSCRDVNAGRRHKIALLTNFINKTDDFATLFLYVAKKCLELLFELTAYA